MEGGSDETIMFYCIPVYSISDSTIEVKTASLQVLFLLKELYKDRADL